MDVNIQTLRIFCKVIEVKTFSNAAKALKITQPTVSQQIGRLELEIGAKVFERVGHSIYITSIGKELYKVAKDILEKATEFSERLHDHKSLPSGIVRFAMPESCQWTLHYRKIMAQIRQFPEIRFEISILTNESIIDRLIKAEIDFVFIAGEKLHPELRFEKFSDEHYSAVASEKNLLLPLKQQKYEQLRLISFPGWEEFFATWARALGLWNEIHSHFSSSTIAIGTLAGAIHAAQEGAGIAIIPSHCVTEELNNGRLFSFNPSKGKAAMRPIYLTKRIGDPLPKRVELIMNMLKTIRN